MKRRLPSLRERLLRDLLLPLAVTWLVGATVTGAIAVLFAQRALDRSLLDDAYLLASNVRLDGGKLQLSLTDRELRTVLFDQTETMHFSVRLADGTLLAGDPKLLMDKPAQQALQEGSTYEFDEVALGGRVLRAVRLEREQPQAFTVLVAQTTTTRAALLERLMLYSVLPQILLLIGLALWLGRTIRRDMAPLSRLEEAVENRDADDLQPVTVRATSHDVAALADAINALLQRLEISLRSQREFSGNVAHELRTPLAGIRALASYGLSHQEPAVWREQLQAIAASEARASRLVEKLLALAVAAEAEAGLRLAPVSLDRLVREAVLRHLPRADAAGVDLGARGIERPVQVQGDATLIEAILDNLLDNALRYGVTPGASDAAITVAVDAEAEGVTLSVQDNGPGMPPEQQALLVDRGSQGEAGRLLGQGAGIGLALVAQHARLMKARMELGQAEGGRGWVCRIRFRAPLRLDPAAPGRDGSSPPAA